MYLADHRRTLHILQGGVENGGRRWLELGASRGSGHERWVVGMALRFLLSGSSTTDFVGCTTALRSQVGMDRLSAEYHNTGAGGGRALIARRRRYRGTELDVKWLEEAALRSCADWLT
jgi:hypothetical protein